MLLIGAMLFLMETFIGLGNNHLIIVGGLFCFNFLNDKVNSEQSTPIGYNVDGIGEVKFANLKNETK